MNNLGSLGSNYNKHNNVSARSQAIYISVVESRKNIMY